MTMMANSDATQLMRIRAEELLERKGTGAPRQAGDLAGQFSAMLEQLNGVGASAGAEPAEMLATSVSPAPTVQHRLGVGAVSVFAQSVGEADGGDGAQTPDPHPPKPEEALQVVESALRANNVPNDFRWLTTLLTQGVPETPSA
ncbi:hypothetical protein [Azospirillum soli]|uniref:hypothetical protein n=1 Tax=Azospirillum soli TaxID=1304799 RepID=UPI001AE7FD50|nr:hypothetical protein [Azospirillum soli]MBP2313826.1 hypothetical protein [Azospirillum soli]